MCKPGNQTIYRECLEEARKINNSGPLSNKELRRIIVLHGGCLQVDNKKALVLN